MEKPSANKRVLTLVLAFTVFAGTGLAISAMPHRDGVNIAAWVVIGLALLVLAGLFIPAILRKRREAKR